jgi:hypothetical protein
MVFCPNVLPFLQGYSALFRHPNDELNFCCYIIPGNPKVKQEDLAYWHNFILTKDPSVVKALGDNYKIERMKAGQLNRKKKERGGGNFLLGDHYKIECMKAGQLNNNSDRRKNRRRG